MASKLSFTNLDPNRDYSIYLNGCLRGGLSKVGIGGETCVIDVEPGVYETRLSTQSLGFPILCIPVYILVSPSKKSVSALLIFRVTSRYLKTNIYLETGELLNGLTHELGFYSRGPTAVYSTSSLKNILKGNGYRWPSNKDIMNFLIKRFNENER